MTTGWQDQADAVLRSVLRLLPASGVYVHGSAALGGWRPGSDLDVLVVVPDDVAGVETDWASVGRSILAAALGPAADVALELSAVTSSVAAEPTYQCPYLFHVNSAENRAAPGRSDGDPDLVSHIAVTRAAGVSLAGPPPATVFGAVPRDLLVRYLRDELAWGLAEADTTYAVLNACRAAAYAEEGTLLSKVDGAAWALDRWPQHAGLVGLARDEHVAGRLLGTADAPARAFVEGVAARLT